MSKWVLGHPSWMVRKLHPHTPKSDNTKNKIKLVTQRMATTLMTIRQQKSSKSSTVVLLLHQTVFDQ